MVPIVPNGINVKVEWYHETTLNAVIMTESYF